MMPRDHQNHRMARSSFYGSSQNSSSQSASGRGKYRQQNNQDIPQAEKFFVHSPGDVSLKNIIDNLSGKPLGRFRTTIVTIISKDSISQPIKSHIVQALIKDIRDRDEPCDETCKTASVDKQELLFHSFDGPTSNLIENQIVGHIDYSTGLIVLYLSSLMEAATLSLMSANKNLPGDENKCPPTIANTWPVRNHNLLKTMLLLFSVSHIVIFYNPEPNMDYNLIQLFKMLQSLVSKSRPRMVDLLEAIATTQVFPQPWVRQAKVSCPRALFVCDTSYMNYELDKTQLSVMKQNLEDQIYLLLNKTNIISKSVTSQCQQQPLLCLPDRGDFVFFITSKDLKNLNIIRPKLSSGEDSSMSHIYSELTNLLIGEDDEMKPKQAGDTRIFKDDDAYCDETHRDKKPSNTRCMRFWKFVNKHIVDIQTKQSSSIISPRLDDLFTVIFRLKSLLFPMIQSVEGSGDHILEAKAPDERRFVDIYDLLNVEELFSKRHCQRARSAAMDAYIRSVQLPDTTHQMALMSAKELYLNHARGPARETNLNLLVEQCNRHWLDSGNINRDWEQDCSSGSPNKSTTRAVSRTMSSLIGGSAGRDSDRSPVSPDDIGASTSNNGNKKCPLVILRRANGIKVITTCECGKDTSLLVKPVDRKKRLERVDVLRLNE